MSLPKLLGTRYLYARRNQSYVSLITLFSILGVTLGVATLIVVLSVMDGFETALKKRLSQGEFHILVTHKNGHFPLDESVISKIYNVDPGILAVQPTLKTEAILRTGGKVAGMSLRGILPIHVGSIAEQIIEAAEDAPSDSFTDSGIWIGKELAYRLGILAGDKVSVISPLETEGPLGAIPKLRRFHVDAIYESGIPEKDSHVTFANIYNVQSFLNTSNVVNQIEIRINNFENSVVPARKIRKILSQDFIVKDWEQLNSHLFSSLLLERIAMFVVLAMIVLVASFNIVTSLSMTVLEKKSEISILKAMGAQTKQIAQTFLVQSSIIGFVGTVSGSLIGLSVCYLLKTTQLITLPDIFLDRTLPVEVTPIYITMIIVTAFALVLLAGYFPAKSAARVTPLEGIRDL